MTALTAARQAQLRANLITNVIDQKAGHPRTTLSVINVMPGRADPAGAIPPKLCRSSPFQQAYELLIVPSPQVNRWIKLPIASARPQLIFVLDSVFGSKESKAYFLCLKREKGAVDAAPFAINTLACFALAGPQPSAFTRADRRDTLRAAVFL